MSFLLLCLPAVPENAAQMQQSSLMTGSLVGTALVVLLLARVGIPALDL